MIQILGFAFFFLLIILIIGIALAFKVFRSILGLGRKMTRNTQTSETKTQSEDFYNNTKTSDQTQKKKIFDKDEGEYVDFEEIKE